MKFTWFVVSCILVNLVTIRVFAIGPQVDLNKKVIGVDNMKPVDGNMVGLPYRYRDVAESVGLMSMGCTGTHIGNGLVVSAGHCFSSVNGAKFHSSCAGVQVFWGVRHGKSNSLVSNCRQVLVYEQNNQKDYALFKVDLAPKAALKIRAQSPVPLGTRVTIFSHPGQNPLMWSGYCEIGRGLGYSLSAQFIHHNCDTSIGSSGAAIVDAASLEVVGLHGGGTKPEGRTGTNYGTHINHTAIPAILLRLGYR